MRNKTERWKRRENSFSFYDLFLWKFSGSFSNEFSSVSWLSAHFTFVFVDVFFHCKEDEEKNIICLWTWNIHESFSAFIIFFFFKWSTKKPDSKTSFLNVFIHARNISQRVAVGTLKKSIWYCLGIDLVFLDERFVNVFISFWDFTFPKYLFLDLKFHFFYWIIESFDSYVVLLCQILSNYKNSILLNVLDRYHTL